METPKLPEVGRTPKSSGTGGLMGRIEDELGLNIEELQQYAIECMETLNSATTKMEKQRSVAMYFLRIHGYRD